MSNTILTKPKILVVSGSFRQESLTRIVLKHVAALVAKRGLKPRFVCARELALPIYDPPAVDELPNAKCWREAVSSSDGLIIGSPEYHGSFSGALKNMIDYLDFPHIEGKLIGLVAAAGGPKSGISTLNALRLTFRALHAPVIIEQAALWEGDFAVDTKQIKPEPLKQLLGVVDGLAREINRCNSHF
jgi:NAD(P)H-dependent FMN reductase